MKMKKQMLAGAIAGLLALSLTACGGGGGTTTSPTDTQGSSTLTSSDSPLTVLIGSSGDAETAAVTAAVAAWSAQSGIQATVVPASNLDQQLAQGFASGQPADVFYLGTGSLADYASAGDLLAYGDLLPNKADFFPSLVANFTYNGTFYAAPKDFSTLQLIINTDMWTAAGLTDADYPTTWDQLHSVAQKLTTSDATGLVVSGQYERLGAFMVQNGSNLMSVDGTQVTANSQANVDALTFAKTMLTDGSMKFAGDIGTGWGGEAFGTGKAAMTIEGNWITGAMGSDYASINYKVIPLPAGPVGKGTLQFTNAWGIAADSPNQQAAVDLVEYLTALPQQMNFASAFGVMPSIQSAATQWSAAFPQLAPFMDAASYAQGVPTLKGSNQVISDLDNQIAQLATTDPATILNSAQSELEALM